MILASRTAAIAHAPGIDRLDESPFGTGRCGTDAAALIDSVADHVSAQRRPLTLTSVADAIDAAVLAGTSRSNDSGPGASAVAAVLAGLADLGRNADALGPEQLAMALEVAAERVAAVPIARGEAVTRLLVVVARAALALSDDGVGLADLVVAIADAGLDELERAAAEDDARAEAGVVDPASAAVLVVMDSLVAVVHGDDPELPAWEFPERWEFAPEEDELGVIDGTGVVAGRYRVSLDLEATEDVSEILGRAWAALGDAVAIDAVPIDAVPIDAVPIEAVAFAEVGQLRWAASVLSDDIGAVIEAALAVGRPRNIRVEDRHG